jgi:hypothetical protein
MCLPLAVIGGSRSRVGIGMQYAGQKKADHALSRRSTRSATGNIRSRRIRLASSRTASLRSATWRIRPPRLQPRPIASPFDSVTQNADPVASGYLPSVGSGAARLSRRKARALAPSRTQRHRWACSSPGGDVGFGDLQQKKHRHRPQQINPSAKSAGSCAARWTRCSRKWTPPSRRAATCGCSAASLSQSGRR